MSPMQNISSPDHNHLQKFLLPVRKKTGELWDRLMTRVLRLLRNESFRGNMIDFTLIMVLFSTAVIATIIVMRNTLSIMLNQLGK